MPVGYLQVYQWRVVRANKACPVGHTLSSSLQNFRVTICSFHFLTLGFSRWRRFHPGRFMSTPSLHHV